MTKYLLDTCIWRDFYENRYGPQGRPLGEYAAKLFMKIIKKKDIIIFSRLTIKELKLAFDERAIEDMVKILTSMGIIEKVETSEKEFVEAEKIARERNLPSADVFHAIVAHNNSAILVSQDKHFRELKYIVDVKKPDELI